MAIVRKINSTGTIGDTSGVNLAEGELGYDKIGNKSLYIGNGDNNTEYPSKQTIDNELALKLNLTGGNLTGNVTVDDNIKIDGRDISIDGSTLDSHVADTSNPHNVTKTQVGLSNVTNDAQIKLADMIDEDNMASDDDTKVPTQQSVKAYSDNTKAPIDSPVLTGTPKAPTADSGDNTTQISTTAFVTSAIADVVASDIGVTVSGNLTSTNVQDGLEELQGDIDTHTLSIKDLTIIAVGLS